MSISINQFCDMLMGEKLLCIYRVCDMLCFDFGEYYERKNYKGELKLYSTKSLHILSNSFRVLAEGKIALCIQDLFEPIAEGVDPLWGEADTLQYDRVAKELNKRYKNERVQKIVISEANDISIYTENLCITAFVTDSGRDSHDESWRLFSRIPEDAPHLVVNGVGAWLGGDVGEWIGGEKN